MQQIIQCVPNFSEGRNLETVEAIADAIRSVESVRLIDHSSDGDHNRSVYTILGGTEPIRAAILAAVSAAIERIDLRGHKGGHPRIGAADVIPLVPLRGITMRECVETSYLMGEDLGALGIPVYFYEQSARHLHRSNLADVRRGGFERLCVVGLDGECAPDAGPRVLHPSAGATVVGARSPLVAYNVNLDSRDLDAAREIATKTRAARSGLTGVKAIGVWLASSSIAQVSMNITRPELASLKQVFDFVCERAAERGIRVLESEVIGAIPLKSLEGATSEDLQIAGFRGSQILETWLD